MEPTEEKHQIPASGANFGLPHDEIDNVVDCLNVEEEHSYHIVIALVQARKANMVGIRGAKHTRRTIDSLDKRVDAGSERSVEPSSPLTDYNKH